jgi:hypothetical protein
MTILHTLRSRLSPGSADSADEHATTTEGKVPFAGYGSLDDRGVMKALSSHSQTELEEIESYERSHGNRQSVLDKLRYMRGREPLPGYDALGAEDIISELKGADLATISAVRAYERKFAHRPDVLEAAARSRRRRHATEPAGPAPGYQPMSASASNGTRPKAGD